MLAKRKYEQVLHRLLAEVVVDAEDRLLGEDLVQRRVELLGRLRGRARTASPPRPARSSAQPDAREALDHGREQRRRDREVVARALPRRPSASAQRGERRGVAVVAVDVARAAPRACRTTASSTVARAPPRLSCARSRSCVVVPVLRRDADRPARRAVRAHHRLRAPGRSSCTRGRRWRRRDDAARRRVPEPLTRARGHRGHLLDVPAEPHAHRGEHLVGEVGLAARAEPLEERRGQHGRRHALVDRRRSTVQRPSPESDTRPAKPASSGPARSAAAVRSSSQDADDAAPPPHLGDVARGRARTGSARGGAAACVSASVRLLLAADVGVARGR